jgi:hypothetical protein
MSDSIPPSDNKITVDCMDSLLSNNIQTRNFYFPVFVKIAQKADGALSEVIGQYIISYIERFPKEFSVKATSIEGQQMHNWASYVGYELKFQYKNSQKAEERINKIVSRCSTCNPTQKKTLKSFNKLSIEQMNELMDD